MVPFVRGVEHAHHEMTLFRHGLLYGVKSRLQSWYQQTEY